MTSRPLNCGYVPLVDSAPLIIAKTLGFAAEEGIKLNLLRQPSWAAQRDLLALGHIDAAHMLAPLPIAMSLGLSGMQVQTDALMMLSVNGTVIGASRAVAAQMRASGWDGSFLNPVGTRTALLSNVKRPLRVGVPFPFAMHALIFSYWMGRDASRFQLITTPPPLMAESVAHGELDLFCVGEPWGSVAVDSEVAELILPGALVWQFAPEKVLAARRIWVEQNPETAGALMRAILRAAKWLDTPDNHVLASEILARSEYLDMPDHAIDRALTGQLVPFSGSAPVSVPHFLRFHRNSANFPWRSQAAWIGAQIAASAGLDPVATARAAQDCFRPDIYRRHVAQTGIDLPGASAKLEGALQHRTAVASARGNMILGPDAFFDGKVYEMPGED